MGPVWQNPIQRTVRTAHLRVLITVHSFSTQYNTEHFWQLTEQSTIWELSLTKKSSGKEKPRIPTEDK